MTIKSDRVAELIQTHLSQLLLTDVRDPRLYGLTITEVQLDREIEHADIFVSALGDDAREDEVMAGLKKAQGFLRRELAQRLRLRRMPQLHFKWDLILQQGHHMEAVLDSLRAESELENQEQVPSAIEDDDDNHEK